MTKILKVVGASWLQTKISSYILGLLGVLAILALFVGQIERIKEDGNYAATVFYSEKTGYSIEYWGQSNELANIPRGVARAYFRGEIDTVGWSLLEIETNGTYPDEVQAYAAGIVEGALTWYLIHIHLENTIRAKCEDRPIERQCDKLRDHLDRSANIWKTYAADRSSTDPFWHHVSLHYTQIGGIFTGWKHGVEKSQKEYETDISDLYWLNFVSEVMEVQDKLNISLVDPTLNMLPGLSSAFVRVAGDDAEKKLFVAHNAAGSYSTMTRIMKRYKFNYHLTSKDPTPAPGITVDFSGYPGSVTSQDEFYVINGDDHRMAVTGTPLRNFNKNLRKDVNITEQVPIGPRISAANHLATNVSSWGHLIARSNSGTACKQWLVVDFNKFDSLRHINVDVHTEDKKEVIKETMVNNDTRHTIVHRAGSGRTKGLMWLIEQIPGRTHSADISDAFLERQYWATYGLPYFKDIAEITYVTKMEELYGTIFSSSESPRARAFERGFKNATSVKSILKLMRVNNITALNSSSAHCDNCLLNKTAYSVLGMRGDIIEEFNTPYGVIDTKVVFGSSKDSSLQLTGISSPPFTEYNSTVPINKGNIATIYTDKFDDVPSLNGLEIRDLVRQRRLEEEEEAIKELTKDVIKPFKWSESEYKDEAHEGLPDLWNFGPFVPNWSW
ncbi:putative phospholipase B-like lamina ancestor [Leptidea sinapis]|uniref:putative phospholipase B-like lamina ancestor n=1 Tax=Leptidea sinapis TaxID=189913 RepID=UPI002140DC04|nr:putative phospholipase B-like lamina ancestor [Leptidea sinapis]